MNFQKVQKFPFKTQKMSYALYSIDFISTILNSISFFPYYLTGLVPMLLPSIKFLDIIILMISTKKSQSYSIFTVLILLISHTLKVLLFFFEEYSKIILGQSTIQIIVAFSMTFLKFHYEEPLNDFPFMSQNINLTFSNRIRFFDLSRLFYLNRSKSFFEFFFSVLFHALLSSGFFIVLYFLCSKKVTIQIIGVLSNLIGSLDMLPSFHRILKNLKNKDVTFLSVSHFLCCDLLELLILLYCSAPLMFIVGVSVQIFFDVSFFALLFAFKCCGWESEVDEDNLLAPVLESDSEGEMESGSSFLLESDLRNSIYSSSEKVVDELLPEKSQNQS